MSTESATMRSCERVPGLGARSLRVFHRWAYHRLMRLMMLSFQLALLMARMVGRLGKKPPCQHPPDGWRVLLTGTFHADNWVKAHLLPLAQSRGCSRVWVVSTSPVPDMPKVKAIYVPAWLIRFLGRTPARILTFFWTAIRYQPDLVGGFALFVNGLAASLMAPIVGARSIYFCVGGPVEVQDGGVWTESGPLARMETPDPVVEKRLLSIVKGMDLVVTMGSRAADYFRIKGVKENIHVIAGGIDGEAFKPAEKPPVYDLILAARLAEIKRIDLFLRIVKDISLQIPTVKAVIVGDGPLRSNLEQLAHELEISRQVEFAGHQQNMGDWFRQTQIFVLTSESEGLSLALMEAMMCGLPAVVSNVGDLGDLVEDGINGYLVDKNDTGAFVQRIVGLLREEEKLKAFSQAARLSALSYETSNTIHIWETIIPPKKLISGRPVWQDKTA